MSTRSRYPASLDVFMPLIDGLHGMAADDINVLMHAMEQIQQTLGFGPQANSSSYGPKGEAADVAERLANLFNTNDATLNDFAFVTGTCDLVALTDINPLGDAGFLIPYGITMSGPDVMVLFSTCMPGEDSDGTQSQNVTGAWWVTFQTTTGVRLQARLANGQQISLDNTATVNYGLLAFGPKAYY